MSNHITDLVVPLHHARLNLNTAYPDQAKIADLCDAAAYKLKELEAENERLRAIYDALLPLKVRGKPVYHLDSKLNAAVHMVAQADEEALQDKEPEEPLTMCNRHGHFGKGLCPKCDDQALAAVEGKDDE